MDPLSEVLAAVRLQCSVFGRARARSPWGFSVPAQRGHVRFHYVLRGSCWLAVDNSSAQRVALSGGDLAVVAGGRGHTLRDHPRGAATPLPDPRASEGPWRIVLGGSGPETDIISGCVGFDDLPETPVLSTLPPIFRLTPDVGHAVPSFEQNLQFMAREVESNRPGAETVLTRMAEVIFVQVLRAYIESLPEGTEGFLGALRDGHISAALGWMHQRPEEAWTVASLAAKVGLSRSVFAARFAALVGESPVGYLTRVRMQKAAVLLRDGATLAIVSGKAGYASEASFSHAFRQWAGVAPGHYRRALRAPNRRA